MEIFAVLALVILLWMSWQLYRAKQFNQFKLLISKEIQPLAIEHIKQALIESRSERLPNSDCHIQASIYYWCQYRSRVLQYALEHQLVDKVWLEKTGNYRHCQHLFHVEAPYLHHFQAKMEAVAEERN